MNDVSILLIAALVGAGLPAYIYGLAFLISWAYVGVCALLVRNIPLEERRQHLDGPGHAPFVSLLFWAGHPAWSHWWRDPDIIGWIIARALLELVLSVIPKLIWLHWWH